MYVYMIVSCVYVHVVDVRSYNVRIHMDGKMLIRVAAISRLASRDNELTSLYPRTSE